MKVLVCDIECTTSNKGNPHDSSNIMSYLGLFDGESYYTYDIEYSTSSYGESLAECQKLIDSCDIIVGFNLKFDLTWLSKYKLNFDNKRVWDCQLYHFMALGQTTPYPSLNGVAAHYDLGTKDDEVAKYWEAGIDTNSIPKEILESYLKKDLELTYEIYNKQQEEFVNKPQRFKRLVSLQNQDLLVLRVIEENGFYFNEEACKLKSQELTATINELRMELNDYHNIEEFNTESGDHISALLYGGTITIPRKEHIGTYKTGDRKGQDKYGWKDTVYTLPRLFNPLPRTELKKDGYWATGEDVLKQLKSRDKAAKRVIEVILSLAKLEKIVGTYYNGLPKLREQMNWKPNMLYGNLNQVTARTGRLSSTKPNLQNLASESKIIFESRFK